MQAAANQDEPGLEGGFALGDLRVEPGEGSVSGPGGREQLDPKVMSVLVVLAGRAQQVVSRDELLERVWPGVVVSDDALTRCLYELRRHLGKAGGSETWRETIETLPKRGYRLNRQVGPLATFGPARNRRRWWAVAAIALATVAVAAGIWKLLEQPTVTPVVAVLPFADMSEDQDQSYLADGVADEILNRLNQSDGMRVIARQSSFAFRGKLVSIEEVAQKLDATHVLEGSIRRSGDRIRITAQLIEADDSTHLWSESFDRQVGDVFAIEDEISNAVAAALRTSLSASPEDGGTSNFEAFLSYSQGNAFYYRREPGDVERARESYERAVALDPNYGAAWAALSGAYGLLAMETDPPDSRLFQKQGEAALEAVALAPRLGSAQDRLGRFYARSGRRDLARRHFEEAARVDPGNPLVLATLARHAVNRGDYRAAVAFMRKAVAADPMALVSRSNYGSYLLAAGEAEAALAEFRSVRENSVGENPDTDSDIVEALVMLRRYDEAAAVADRMPEGMDRDHSLAILVAAPDRRDSANAAFERLKAAPEPLGLNDAVLWTARLAEAYAVRGMNDESIETLLSKRNELEARKDLSVSGVLYLRQLAQLSPILQSLKSEPRWQELMKEPA